MDRQTSYKNIHQIIFFLSVISIMTGIYTFLRHYLYQSVVFQWHDFDVYFVVFFPLVISFFSAGWAVIFWFKKDHSLDENFLQTKLHFAVIFAAVFITSQLLYNSLTRGVFALENPKQLQGDPGIKYVNFEQIDIDTSSYDYLHERKLIYSREMSKHKRYEIGDSEHRGMYVEGVELKAYVVFEVKGMNNEAFLGQFYREIHKTQNGEKGDEKLAAFLETVEAKIKTAQFDTEKNFKVVSYSRKKRKYTQAVIKKLKRRVSHRDIIILEEASPKTNLLTIIFSTILLMNTIGMVFCSKWLFNKHKVRRNKRYRKYEYETMFDDF